MTWATWLRLESSFCGVLFFARGLSSRELMFLGASDLSLAAFELRGKSISSLQSCTASEHLHQRDETH